MHGGMKFYAGAPSAALHYVEADRGRADDYYLTEVTGLARRYTAADGRVQELAPLAGDDYEAWVAGTDPDTGKPRGRLRTDDAAVVEFSDSGRLTEPLLGRVPPEVDRHGGRGLYLVNQLCDLVQVRSGSWGTAVLITTWR